MAEQITARSMKMKEQVTLKDPVIIRRHRSRGTGFMYQAKGLDPQGNTCYAMIGEAKALQAIKDNVAKKDEESWAISAKPKP